jgi:hypothetical protein
MPADTGTTGRNPAPRRRKRQRTDDTVRQLSLQEARAEAQARRQARAAEDYHREQALRANAPEGRAKVRAKPGLETPNARPRDYTHPVNPYRPTPQEARAARAQLEQQRLEANLIPLSPAMRFAGRFTKGAGEAYLGFVPGVIQTAQHPIRTAEQVGQSYAHTYGPAVHGDFGETLHRINQDPFGPVMDAWTLATFGAARRASPSTAAPSPGTPRRTRSPAASRTGTTASAKRTPTHGSSGRRRAPSGTSGSRDRSTSSASRRH